MITNFITHPLGDGKEMELEERTKKVYNILLSDALLIFNVPFTFVKGMIDVVITFLVYKRLSPIIKGTNSKKQTPDT